MKILIFIFPFYFLFTYEFVLSQFIAINFPTEHHPPPPPPPPSTPVPTTRVGSFCQHHSGSHGRCRPLSRCGEILNRILRHEVRFIDVKCTTKSHRRNSLVCCAIKSDNVGEILDISPPDGIYDDCGRTWLDFGTTHLGEIYIGNNTAEEFKAKGFSVTVRELTFDHIIAFDYTNGSHSGTWFYTPINRAFGVGGLNARRVLAVYMALLGTSEGWLCDGVLINSQWVLTAAHCFDNQSPTIVRLGEYDFSDGRDKRTEVPLDFSLSEIVIYPEYSFPSSYHDLALIKLNKRIPQLRPDLSPVCLPWAEESLTDLVGRLVTLTGWGASVFLGPSTPILQEVNVTVFSPSVCDRSYSALFGYRSTFPNGIRKETSLCAGDELGGKDACQGDSGGPIVYLARSNRYTLAGIVSTGNGCGLKEYPGIYVPLHNPKYLSWIKRVAF